MAKMNKPIHFIISFAIIDCALIYPRMHLKYLV